MTVIDHALALAAQGFHVFPLLPGSKKPAVRGWQGVATRDPERIRTLFADGMNVGIATECFGDDGALLVVDVDNKHGARDKGGDASVLQLELEGHEFPSTLEACTPSGGRHLFYRVAIACQSGVENVAPGIDTRSAGGYVVGAGSRLAHELLPEGAECDSYSFRVPAAALADAPAWLVQRVGAKRERDPQADTPLPGVDPVRAHERAIDYLQHTAPEAIEGAGGDATTYAVAARVKDFGVGQGDCLALLQRYWFEGCGWQPEDLAAKVANAYKYGVDRQGADAPEAIFGAVPVPVHAARFHLASVAETIALAPPNWLVRGILPEQGMAVVYGAPGSGKTFLVLDVACAIARGTAWGGRRVRRGRCVYVGLEGHSGTRVAAYVQGHGIDAADLGRLSIIERQMLNLLQPGDPKQLARDIRAALPEPPAMIVLDTLNRSMPGGDENDSEDMGRAIFAAHLLSVELGCLVLFVHHSGKAEGAGARGHSSLLGAADAELAVTRDEEGERCVELTKAKDGEDGVRFRFKLKSVDLGAVREYDAEAAADERRTSCIIEGLREAASAHVAPRVKLGTHAAIALRALRDALTAVDASNDTPFAGEGVMVPQWQAQFEAQYVDDPAWRRHFFTARTELLRKRIIMQPVRGRVALTEAGAQQ